MRLAFLSRNPSGTDQPGSHDSLLRHHEREFFGNLLGDGPEGRETMNRKKRTVFGIALLLMVVMGLYPPWVVSYSYPNGSVAYSAGYSFILAPPFSGL
jgi:hypothetical protein